MSSEYRVNVYDGNEIIGRVRYNQNLDYWDGRNFSNGGNGHHKGLTKLKTGEYVLIHGTDWQGEKDYAEIISKQEALQEILRSQNLDLLETKKFAELRQLAVEKGLLDSEYEED